MSKIFKVIVQYEDTDFSRAVYHANYLNFIERARSSKIALLGIDQLELLQSGMTFVVRKLIVSFIKPAHFGDNLEITTDFLKIGGASMELRQKIFKKSECIFEAKVKLALVCDHRVIRIPKLIKEKLLQQDNV